MSLKPYTMRPRNLALICIAVASSQQIIAVSLSEALNSAYRTNSALKSIEQTYKAQQELQRATLSAYLPQASFTGNVVGKHRDSHEPKRSICWEFTQPIFNLSLADQYFASEQATQSTYYQEELLRDSIRRGVEIAYFQAQKNVAQELYINNLGQSSKSIFNKALQSFEVGFLDVPQKLQSEALFAQESASIKNYHYAYLGCQATLLQETNLTIDLHHLQPQTLQGLLQECMLPAFSLVVCRESAQKNRKELSILCHEMMSEHFLARSYFHQYLPTISAFAIVSHGRFDYPAITVTASWHVGISLHWDFDGFCGLHSGHAAQARALAKWFEQENMVSLVQKDVDLAYYDLQTQQENLKAQETQYSQARAEFARKQQQYDVGEIAKPEFDEARTNFCSMKGTLQQQAIEVKQAHSQLLAACGYPKTLDTLR